MVIPYYRHFDHNPQFYCVEAIDHALSPLSAFPSASSGHHHHHQHHHNQAVYETFFQYFAVKYNLLITDLTQPLLVVSHPSTRLNLLTPRYMNLKASVLQKTYLNATAAGNDKSSKSKNSNGGSSSSSRIYLVPEVNLLIFQTGINKGL